MSCFDEATRRIEQYRICLDRDVARGIIAGAAHESVDGGFQSLESLLRAARVELEGAGTMADPFREHFVGGCAMLALQLFRAMYREGDPHRLGRIAHELRAEGRRLMEHLWARLETAA